MLEILIAVAIGAIVVSIALPSFLSSIKKGRRSEAMTALTAIQQEQERWRSNNTTYSSSLSELRVTSPTSPGGYYTLTVSGNTDTGYTAVANGTGSTQSGDGDCAKLGVRVARGAITYASCRSCADADLVFAAQNSCWAR